MERPQRTTEIRKLNDYLKSKGWIFVENADDVNFAWYRPDYKTQTTIFLSHSFDDPQADPKANYSVSITRNWLIAEPMERKLFFGFAKKSTVKTLIETLIKHVQI